MGIYYIRGCIIGIIGMMLRCSLLRTSKHYEPFEPSQSLHTRRHSQLSGYSGSLCREADDMLYPVFRYMICKF